MNPLKEDIYISMEDSHLHALQLAMTHGGMKFLMGQWPITQRNQISGQTEEIIG